VENEEVRERVGEGVRGEGEGLSGHGGGSYGPVLGGGKRCTVGEHGGVHVCCVNSNGGGWRGCHYLGGYFAVTAAIVVDCTV